MSDEGSDDRFAEVPLVDRDRLGSKDDDSGSPEEPDNVAAASMEETIAILRAAGISADAFGHSNERAAPSSETVEPSQDEAGG